MTETRLNINEWLKASGSVISLMVENCSQDIESAADLIFNALSNGNKILWCGNGGSAGQAQHLSTELVGGLRTHDRPPMASISLTTDSSFLTAWANDTGYETVFSRQVEALGQSGDVLIAISTSGSSRNVLEACKVALKMGLKVISFSRDGQNELSQLGNISISIPSADTQRIQEGHLVAGHIICELVESRALNT